jgi:hypothetical protein
VFGLLRKKKPANALDEFIHLVYGNPPPPKRASVRDATKLAFEQLLMLRVSEQEVRTVAEELSSGPIPYSTHDLALSVALNFFMQPARVDGLREAQLQARLKATDWVLAGFAVPMTAKSFEEVLYKLYKPAPRSETGPTPLTPDRLKRAYLDLMAVIVGLPLKGWSAATKKDALCACEDVWVASYIFAAHITLLANYGVDLAKSPDVLLMTESYANLFPDPGAGEAALAAIKSNSASNEDADLELGFTAGAEDVKFCLATGKRPERLTDRLFSTARA